MPEQSVWPIDTCELKKGDYISSQRLSELTNLSVGSPQYAFKLMSLKKFITKALAKRGLLVTVAIRQDGLAILTDQEAAIYNVKFAKSGARRIKRSAVRHSVIDLSKLTPAEREQWDKDARRLAAMSEGVRPTIKLTPHKRIS